MNITSPQVNTSRDEVSDIFRLYSDRYLSDNKISKRQYSVISAIKNCHTPALGYHLDQCNSCGHLEKEYNSCRDRHCPKCQGISRKKWIDSRLNEVLSVPYYHTVFTLPHFLNELISYNKKLIYELLLSKSAETLLAFGRDPRKIQYAPIRFWLRSFQRLFCGMPICRLRSGILGKKAIRRPCYGSIIFTLKQDYAVWQNTVWHNKSLNQIVCILLEGALHSPSA